ncbi:MAG: hypothetical protein J0G94_04525, partial [Sphingomonadales bacterium]|nr:hypothetical protein [Sphingomonadales bacterium]
MQARSWSTLTRFGIAGLIVLLAVGLCLALAPWAAEASFLLFAPVILGLALWFGSISAVFAAVLLSAFILGLAAVRGLALLDYAQTALFFGSALVIILLGETINRSRRRAIESDRVASQRAGEATDLAEELNLLIDGAHGLAIYMLDPTGKVTIWNSGAERLQGWT